MTEHEQQAGEARAEAEEEGHSPSREEVDDLGYRDADEERAYEEQGDQEPEGEDES